MTDYVKAWVSNARGAEYGFFKAVQYALEQFGEKNNKPMYALIAFTNGKSFGSYKIEDGYKLSQFSAPLKRILNVALSDVKFTFKDGKASCKVGKNGGLNNDVLEGVRTLAASNVGIKSQAFKDAFPVLTADKPEKSHDQYFEQLHKYMEKMAKDMGVSLAQVQAMATAKPTAKAA
jgi:hypothetical protein